jgi:predicted PolB exonuclease-like 3'-5' exonuclease
MNIFKFNPLYDIGVSLGEQKAFNEYLDKRLDLLNDYMKLQNEKIDKLMELNQKQAELILALSKKIRES